MPMFPPNLTEALNSLQRQIDQINTSRPGPMSWGPDDGHIRIYKADGEGVWFEAASSGGAQVESRGALTGLTPLLDSIRDLNDGQNNQLSNHRQWIIDARAVADAAQQTNDAQNRTLSDHRGWIINAADVANTARDVNEAQNRTLSDHRGWIVNAAESAADAKTLANAAQSRADNAHADAATAQARANAAHSNAQNAHNRADSAYSLASGRATQTQIQTLEAAIDNLRNRVARLEALGPG